MPVDLGASAQLLEAVLLLAVAGLIAARGLGHLQRPWQAQLLAMAGILAGLALIAIAWRASSALGSSLFDRAGSDPQLSRHRDIGAILLLSSLATSCGLALGKQ